MKQRGSKRAGRGGGGRQVNTSALSRTGRGRFGKGKPIQKDKGPEARRKWLHHCLRTLHKALKNARTFEQRKLKRRLVLQQQQQREGHQQAEAAAAEQRELGPRQVEDPPRAQPPEAPQDGAVRGSSPPTTRSSLAGDGEKLRSQLKMSKALDLDALAVQLALRSGFPEDLVRAAAPRRAPPAPPSRAAKSNQQQQQEGEGQQQQQQQQRQQQRQQEEEVDRGRDGGGSGCKGGPLAAVLAGRLLRASCVRKVVEEARRDFEAKFGAAALGPEDAGPAPDADQQQPCAEDSGGSEGGDGDSDSDSEEAALDQDEEDDELEGGSHGQEGTPEQEGACAALRPRKRQRTKEGAGDRSEPAGVPRHAATGAITLPDGEDGSWRSEVVGTLGGPADEGEEDSGVIEEADIDDFMAEAARGAPAGGGGGDEDGDIGSGGDTGIDDGDSGSDVSGSASFDSAEFDMPLERRPRGGGGDGGGGLGAAVGVKRQRDSAAAAAVTTAGVTEGKPSLHHRAASANAVVGRGRGDVTGSTQGGRQARQAADKPGTAPAGKARAPAAAVGQEKKARKVNSAGDPLLDRKGKNRLGQNARRRLHEKMYGMEARHLKQRKEGRGRQEGRGQQDGEAVRPAARSGGRSGIGGRNAATAAGADTADAAASIEQLHPSWAAKQRQKQLLRQQASAAAPKKIKFDEEGGDGDNGGGGDGRSGGAGGVRNDVPGVPPRLEGRRGRDVQPSRQTARDAPGCGSGAGRGSGEGRDRRGGGGGVGSGRGMRPESGRGGFGAAGGGGGGGSLHPSWEARQKQKLQLLTAAPAGKKTLFED